MLAVGLLASWAAAAITAFLTDTHLDPALADHATSPRFTSAAKALLLLACAAGPLAVTMLVRHLTPTRQRRHLTSAKAVIYGVGHGAWGTLWLLLLVILPFVDETGWYYHDPAFDLLVATATFLIVGVFGAFEVWTHQTQPAATYHDKEPRRLFAAIGELLCGRLHVHPYGAMLLVSAVTVPACSLVVAGIGHGIEYASKQIRTAEPDFRAPPGGLVLRDAKADHRLRCLREYFAAVTFDGKSLGRWADSACEAAEFQRLCAQDAPLAAIVELRRDLLVSQGLDPALELWRDRWHAKGAMHLEVAEESLDRAVAAGIAVRREEPR